MFWIELGPLEQQLPWTLMKAGVPNSVASKTKSKRNPMLWKYIKSQQWRWEKTGENLFRVTGQTLARLWLAREWKKVAREKLVVWVRIVVGHKTLWGLWITQKKKQKTKKSMIPISGSKWWFCHSEIKDYMFSWDGKKSGGMFMLLKLHRERARKWISTHMCHESWLDTRSSFSEEIWVSRLTA